MSAPALYVHLPFCSSFCPYCDFPKAYYDPNRVGPYFLSLQKEILSKAKGKYDTIYLGGGTPTVVEPSVLEDFLSFLSPYLATGAEFSTEANPETLTEEKIAILAKYGINRVSLGVQSFHDKYLKLLSRHHDEAKVVEVVDLLKKHGISNINLDFMFGLPGESVSEALTDIEKAVSLAPTHISAYSLILEENTPFQRKGIQEASQDDQADQYEAILSYLTQQGYARYEVSNFAKEGYRCRHNLHYWKDDDYDAVGLGAAGHLGNIRYKNTIDFNKYCVGIYEEERELLSREEEIECFLLANLRLLDGFSLATYKSRFGQDFTKEKSEAIAELQSRGLLQIQDGFVLPSEDGILLLDQILVALF